MKKPALIIDIDGTMALHTEEMRGHYEYSKVLYDEPNWYVINMVRRILAYRSPYFPKLTPVYVTGRPDSDNGQVRDDTTIWLNTYTNWDWEYSNLYMRPEFLMDDYGEVRTGHRDYRTDDVVKEELYRKYIEPEFDVDSAIDDRPRVLKMWQRLGIPTFAVGTPWIEF